MWHSRKSQSEESIAVSVFGFCLTLLPPVNGIFHLNETDNIYSWIKSKGDIEKPWINYPLFCITREDEIETTMSITGCYNLMWTCVERSNTKFMFPAAEMKENFRNSGSKIRQIRRAYGRETVHVRYSKLFWTVLLNSNSMMTFIKNVSSWFSYDMFGPFNITFTSFHLSDNCMEGAAEVSKFQGERVEIPKFSHRVRQSQTATERFLTRKTAKKIVHQHLVYCSRRPQWSVFTDSRVDLVYMHCQHCDVHESYFVLEYQVMRDKLMKTSGKYSYAIGGDMGVHTITTYTVENVLNSSVLFAVHGKLHQHILLEKRSRRWRTVRLFVLDSAGKAQEDLVRRKAVPYHRCLLLALADFSISDKIIQKNVDFTFKDAAQTHVSVLEDKETITHLTTLHASVFGHFHNVTRFKTPKHIFIKISIKKLVQSGINNPTCEYGGMSFTENETEILRFCSFLLAENGNKVSFPFSSSSHDILLVIYAEGTTQLDILFDAASTNCQGVFVNPCKPRLFAANYCLHPFRKFPLSSGTVFPKEQEENLWRYGFPFKNPGGKCLAVQLSLLFLTPGTASNQVCKRAFFIRPCHGQGQWVHKCDGKWNGAQLELSHHFVAPKYSNPNPKEEFAKLALYNSHNLNSGSVVVTNRNVPCKENVNDLNEFHANQVENSVWLKRLTFYNSILPNSTGMNKFALNIRLSKTQEKTYDALLLSFEPFSQSAVVLTMEFTSGKLDENLQFSSTNLTTVQNSHICLRNSFKAVLDNNIFVSLEMDHKRNFSQHVADLVMSINLCLSEDYLHTLRIGLNHELSYFTGENIFQTCVPKKMNKGEDSLIWTSKLSSMLFATSQSLDVSLPGKIVDAQLVLNSRDHSESNAHDGSLRVMWFVKPEEVRFNPETGLNDCYGFSTFLRDTILKRPPGHKETYSTRNVLNCHNFTHPHRKRNFSYDLMSRNFLGDYEIPQPRSWLRAREICSTRGQHLPVITFGKDVMILMEYVEKLSFTALLTHIFIGILKQVCCMTNIC